MLSRYDMTWRTLAAGTLKPYVSAYGTIKMGQGRLSAQGIEFENNYMLEFYRNTVKVLYPNGDENQYLDVREESLERLLTKYAMLPKEELTRRRGRRRVYLLRVPGSAPLIFEARENAQRLLEGLRGEGLEAQIEPDWFDEGKYFCYEVNREGVVAAGVRSVDAEIKYPGSFIKTPAILVKEGKEYHPATEEQLTRYLHKEWIWSPW